MEAPLKSDGEIMKENKGERKALPLVRLFAR